MKKCAIVFVVALVGVSVSVSAAPITVENHSFELPGVGPDPANPAKPGIDDIPGWSAGDVNHWSGAETKWGPTDGLYTGYMQTGGQIYNLIDHTIAGGMEYTLTFDLRRTWWGDRTTVDLYYDDNGNRVPMGSEEISFPDLDTTDMVEYTITVQSEAVPASIGKQIGIQVTCGTLNSYQESWVGYDNFRLDGTSLFVIPIHPLPGDTLVPVDDDLEWAVLNNWNVDLYFQVNEPNFAGVAPVRTDTSDTTYEPGTMEPDTTYYWRADAYEPNSTGFIVHTGPVWSFRTAPATPTITLDPITQTVAAGSLVVLAIDGTNIDEAHWFRNGDPITEDVFDLTLTLSDVQVGDEGYYHCVAKNTAGDDTSETARLLTRRLVGWWKLDGNLDDSVADVVPGAPPHPGTGIDAGTGIPTEPNYVPSGADASAIEFLGDDRIVTIDDSAEYFNFSRQGQTVSGWVNTETVVWDGVLSKHYRPEGETWIGWIIDVRDGWGAHVTLRGSYDNIWGPDDEEDMFDGNWHLVTAVMDPDTNTTRFYVNGKLGDTSAEYDLGAALLSDQPVVFGAEAANGVIPYTGMLDDVRIWTYALDDIAIALLYTDFNPGSEVCIGNPTYDIAGPEVDENGDPVPDCRVDLHDLAALGLEWLYCNIVPTCIP